MTLLLMFGFGFVSGLRALTAIAAISWAARLERLSLAGSWLGFLGYHWTPWLLTLAALGEIVNDKLPKTPSRKTPPQFAVRIVLGAISGAAIGIPAGSTLAGIALGALGAIVGTLLGAAARARLVRGIGGKDLPIALTEDAVAVGLVLFLVQLT
ncbi:hypothetical protein ACPOL_1003 [Acidisarcina polymorpha]|uniref:DUF4126 domain-containing protein n=1 Tax=Acidisarcina polymorpha TaxID=2211140 RepID=A0A2Z5FV32_9BACT|nr:DUF4126 family protein [Acidisarcina polymorpha]AXC10354.1 hypothetical protein ACPOL_1003 [Acidisarcina polymorpha]